MGSEARESSRHAAHTSDRKRKTSRPRSSDSSSDSDADSERRHRNRAKHRKKDDKKKKSKKSKKASERTRSSRGEEKRATKSKDKKSKKRRARGRDRSDSEASGSGSCSSESESESERKQDGGVDLERAAEVVRTLLVEFPSISSDLLALLQMLDDGETAVISGIANARVKTLLRCLFPLLGLKKLRKPYDAFVARSGGERPRLLEAVATMLTFPSSANTSSSSHVVAPSDQDGEEEATSAPSTAPRRREAPIGPMMPPPSALSSAPTTYDEEEENDDVVGPALPGMKGYREADERVEAEMARRAKQLEEDEWRRARGEAPAAAAAATGGREAWMTEMPTNNKIFDDAMGPMKPRTGQPAAFRSKEPAKIDSTWFDSPEERERGKRAKLDMELLGYVRPENAPAPGSADQATRVPINGPGVNESILPAANPEADEDMRRQMEVLKQKRGPSLLEQHQKKVAEEQKALRGDGEAERSTWNRDRDLTARRGLSQSDADRIIKASQEISSKFTAPTVTRQFL